MCFEGISELAATEIEEEPLWDGQAKSSRYQDFSRSGFVTPPEFSAGDAEVYGNAGEALLAAYGKVNELALARLAETPAAPRRHEAGRLAAQYRGARFRRGAVSAVLGRAHQRGPGDHHPHAGKADPPLQGFRVCGSARTGRRDGAGMRRGTGLPLGPRGGGRAAGAHLGAPRRARRARRAFAGRPEALGGTEPAARAPRGSAPERVDLVRPTDTPADIAATLLYPVTDRPFRELYEIARGWSAAQRAEVMDVALRSRTARDEILAGFRGGLYAYDFVIDIGAYRDLHRHRRCQKFRQAYSGNLGYDTPKLVAECGAGRSTIPPCAARSTPCTRLPAPGAHYLLPFGARSRFLFKMDFAEAEYIARLRSGVKGHFSYREIAWEMKRKMEQVEPELGRLMEATPPWVEDPLRR